MQPLKKILQSLYDTQFARIFREAFNRRVYNQIVPLLEKQEAMRGEIQGLYHQQAENRKILDEILVKSNSFAPPGLLVGLGEDFSQIVGRLSEAAGCSLEQSASLLFCELLKDYGSGDGLWRLNKELNFLSPAKENQKIDKGTASSGLGNAGNSLKILYVCGLFPSVEHGGGGRIYDILCELVKQHEIDMYTHYNADLDEYTLDKLRNKVRQFQITDLAGINFTDLSAWLESIGRKFSDYDVVQLEYPNTIAMLSAIKKSGGKKVGFTFMECLTKSYLIELDNFISNSEFHRIPHSTKMFWKFLSDEAAALDNADFCVAMTPEDMRVLQAIRPVPVHIIPTCISSSEILDVYEAHKDMPYEENSVAFLGYFDHRPNLDAMEWYLRDIHPLVKAEIKDYRLYIIGRGDTSRLRRIADGDANVRYSGRVDNTVPYIMKAKVCIAPLISGAGIRGKLNQYAVLNRAVVTTSIGNKGIGYRDNESIILADDAQGFACGVVRLLSDQALYEKLRANARQHALENFTWPGQIQRLLDIYYS